MEIDKLPQLNETEGQMRRNEKRRGIFDLRIENFSFEMFVMFSLKFLSEMQRNKF